MRGIVVSPRAYKPTQMPRMWDEEMAVNHSIEAEEGVLGCLLLDWMQAEPEKVTRVMVSLKPKHFYRDKNRWIYDACQALYKGGHPTDQVTVTHELEKQGKLEAVGGAAYLSHILSISTVPLNVEYYARIIRDCYNERRNGH